MNNLRFNTAVIFAGGVGMRMRSKDLPKQFLMIHGKPIIVHTIEQFQHCDAIDNIVVVCVEGWVEYCKNLMRQFGLTKVKVVVPGGKTGQLSINNGLRIAANMSKPDETIVLIHDGVRPFINEKTIVSNIENTRRYGNSITCAKAKETVLIAQDNIVQHIVPRENVLLARAPQSFILADIIAAHDWAKSIGRDDYIDSACLMADFGKNLHLIDGPDENIKITTQEDYYSMRAILDSMENDQLYGIDRELNNG